MPFLQPRSDFNGCQLAMNNESPKQSCYDFKALQRNIQVLTLYLNIELA